MEHKSHRIRTANVPEGNLVYSVIDKSYLFIAAQFNIGLAFLLSERKVMSIPFFVYAAYLLLRPTKQYISVYDKFIVITDQSDPYYSDILYNTEIRYWEFRIKNTRYEIMFYLNDEEKYLLDHHVNMKLHDSLVKTIEDKEIKSKKERIEKGV